MEDVLQPLNYWVYNYYTVTFQDVLRKSDALTQWKQYYQGGGLVQSLLGEAKAFRATVAPGGFNQLDETLGRINSLTDQAVSLPEAQGSMAALLKIMNDDLYREYNHRSLEWSYVYSVHSCPK